MITTKIIVMIMITLLLRLRYVLSSLNSNEETTDNENQERRGGKFQKDNENVERRRDGGEREFLETCVRPRTPTSLAKAHTDVHTNSCLSTLFWPAIATLCMFGMACTSSNNNINNDKRCDTNTRARTHILYTYVCKAYLIWIIIIIILVWHVCVCVCRYKKMIE